MNVISSAVPKPAHIPPGAVYDFDLFADPGLLSDPHERVLELRRAAPPVFWTPRNGGHWVVAGYAAVFEASRDTDVFTSQLVSESQMAQLQALIPAGGPHIPTPTPINLDPPAHTIYRAPLQTAFSPKAMAARREDIRALANALIDKVVIQGHCDFIPDIAEPLPVQVFLKMMGLPLECMTEFRGLVHEFLAPGAQENPQEMFRRMRLVADSMRDVFEARRQEPRDDLISLLWAAEIEGKKMTMELMEDFGVLLFIGGLDTVINGMGYGIRHLARNPDLQAELRANPSRIIDATEEILRRYTFTCPTRRVAKDTVLAGNVLHKDERIVLFLPGADLDAAEFANPDQFDLNRENKVHIAFGAGPHRCLGSHLARVELQVIYEQMLTRLPLFRLDEARLVKFHAGNILAIDSLPLRWD